MSWALWCVLTYLLGSISFSYLIVQALRRRDIRELGSHNAGATNVARMIGWLPGLSVLALDLAKGAIPVLLARYWLEAPGPVVGTTAVATVLGHIWPIYHGFRGGKGVATAAGALGSLAPVPAGLCALLFVLVVAASRYVALGSIAGVACLIPMSWVATAMGWSEPLPGWLQTAALVSAALVVYKHWENLVRIRQGTEYRMASEE